MQLHRVSKQEILCTLFVLCVDWLSGHFDECSEGRVAATVRAFLENDRFSLPLFACVSVCQAVTLTFFGGFHFWLVFNDKTTIEANQVWRNLLRGSLFSRKKRSYYLNWCKVMDTNPWIVLLVCPVYAQWFLPFHSSDFTFSWDFLKVRLRRASQA